jgi:hypothetical protein
MHSAVMVTPEEMIQLVPDFLVEVAVLFIEVLNAQVFVGVLTIETDLSCVQLIQWTRFRMGIGKGEEPLGSKKKECLQNISSRHQLPFSLYDIVLHTLVQECARFDLKRFQLFLNADESPCW